jgi:ABC-type sugar transport system permease subunit
VGPLLCGVLVLVVGPAVYGLSRSFYDWQPGGSSPFVGLSNYSAVATSSTFHTILANEGIYLLGIPLWTVLPIAIATFLSTRVWGAGVVRTIIFMPAVVSPVLLGVMFAPLLSPNGLVNETLARVGLGSLSRAWISDPQLVKPVIIVVLAWASVGLGIAVFTAGLTGISRELVDAAHVEGASSWQRMVNVILPGLRKTVALWVIYNAMSVFLWLFGLIFALTAGGPGDSSASIDYDVYENAIGTNLYGYGAAEAVYLLAIVVLIAVLGWRLTKRWSTE